MLFIKCKAINALFYPPSGLGRFFIIRSRPFLLPENVTVCSSIRRYLKKRVKNLREQMKSPVAKKVIEEEHFKKRQSGPIRT